MNEIISNPSPRHQSLGRWVVPTIITVVLLLAIAVATTFVVRELGHTDRTTLPAPPSDVVAAAPGPDNTITTPLPPPQVPSPQGPPKPAPGGNATTSKGTPR